MKIRLLLCLVLLTSLNSVYPTPICRKAYSDKDYAETTLRRQLGELEEVNQLNDQITRIMKRRNANQPAIFQLIRRRTYHLIELLENGNISGAVALLKPLIVRVEGYFKVISAALANHEAFSSLDAESRAQVQEHLTSMRLYLGRMDVYELYSAYINVLTKAAEVHSSESLHQTIIGTNVMSLESTSPTRSIRKTIREEVEDSNTRQLTAQKVLQTIYRLKLNENTSEATDYFELGNSLGTLLPRLKEITVSPESVRDLAKRLDGNPDLNRAKQTLAFEKAALKLNTLDLAFETFYNSPFGQSLGALIYSKAGFAPILRQIQRMANDRFSYRFFDLIDQLVIDLNGASLERHYKFLQLESSPSKFGDALLVAYFRHIRTLDIRSDIVQFAKEQPNKDHPDTEFAARLEKAFAFARKHGNLEAHERNPVRASELTVLTATIGSALLGSAWYYYNVFDQEEEQLPTPAGIRTK